MQNAEKGSAFQNLLVWQRGMEVAKNTYTLVHALPKEEMFGLTSQMRRCAISIPSNIAEGAKRGKKEFAHFLRIANGSAAELETQLLLSEELYKLDANSILEELTVLQKMIESLIKKV
jgi:four helix bundle protein